MKKIILGAAVIALLSAPAFAAPTFSNVLAGKVITLNAKTITIQRGRGTYEFSRTTGTVIPDTVKVGDVVLVEGKMTATKVTLLPKPKPRTARKPAMAKKPGTAASAPATTTAKPAAAAAAPKAAAPAAAATQPATSFFR